MACYPITTALPADWRDALVEQGAELRDKCDVHILELVTSESQNSFQELLGDTLPSCRGAQTKNEIEFKKLPEDSESANSEGSPDSTSSNLCLHKHSQPECQSSHIPSKDLPEDCMQVFLTVSFGPLASPYLTPEGQMEVMDLIESYCSAKGNPSLYQEVPFVPWNSERIPTGGFPFEKPPCVLQALLQELKSPTWSVASHNLCPNLAYITPGTPICNFCVFFAGCSVAQTLKRQ